jgi:Uma2 family endonuclease
MTAPASEAQDDPMTIAALGRLDPEPPPGADELPYDDGEPMESERHVRQMVLLMQSLEDAWRDRQDYYVGGNMFLYFSLLQTKKNDFRGPDVFVVLDTVRKERRSWVVWEEDGRVPNVIIELLSERTEAVDRGEKMRIYGSVLRVPEYFLFDPLVGTLEGYRLDLGAREYGRLDPDESGQIPSQQLGLGLGVVDGWLRWITRDGAVLQSPSERADANARIAEENAERLRELEARVATYEKGRRPA